MSANRDKVLSKLVKLRALMEGARAIGNQAEAAAAAGKIAELLDRHELEMTDVEYAAAQQEDPMGSTWMDPEGFGVRYSTRRVAWQQRLVAIVARAHHCKMLVHTGSNTYTLVGRLSHREAAQYVAGNLLAFAQEWSLKDYDRLWFKLKRETGDTSLASGYKASWHAGFRTAIADRYKEEAEAMRREAASSGLALVRLEMALTRAEEYTKEQIKPTNVPAVTGRRQHINALGVLAGQARGSGVAIRGKGVGAGREGKRSAIGGGA